MIHLEQAAFLQGRDEWFRAEISRGAAGINAAFSSGLRPFIAKDKMLY